MLDGTTNGRGDEQITVQVGPGAPKRPTAAVVDSTFFGFDCAFNFDLAVPVLPCYELTIDKQTIGRYPGSGSPERRDIGLIDSNNVYGDSDTSEPPAGAG